MDRVYDDYGAAATLAGVASDQADRGPGRRRRAARGDQAGPRHRAGRPSGPRPARPTPIAAERADLIGELARLQGISVALAEQRQEWLEAQATPDADAHADADADAEPTPEPTPTQEPTQRADADRRRTTAQRRLRRRRRAPTPHRDAHPDAHARPRRRRRRRRPTPTPAATPTPTPTPRHRASGGAAARDRLRAGPDRRPLPVGRRRARQVGLLGPDHAARGRRAAISLPHYSAASTTPSTPISEGHAAARRPGVLGLLEQPVVDLPRRPVRRRRDDHPRAADRRGRRGGVDGLLDRAELLRPALTARAVS